MGSLGLILFGLTKDTNHVCSDIRLLAISAQITEVLYNIGELQTRIFG